MRALHERRPGGRPCEREDADEADAPVGVGEHGGPLERCGAREQLPLVGVAGHAVDADDAANDTAADDDGRKGPGLPGRWSAALDEGGRRRRPPPCGLTLGRMAHVDLGAQLIEQPGTLGTGAPASGAPLASGVEHRGDCHHRPEDGEHECERRVRDRPQRERTCDGREHGQHREARSFRDLPEARAARAGDRRRAVR